eukprot:c16217_g1_i1 orf=480-875(-)
MAKHNLAGSRFSQSARFARDYDNKSLEHQRLIEAPSYAWDDSELYLYPVNESYINRQLYLHSYKFTREETLSEKLRSSLSKFKVRAWVVMACNYKPVAVRKLKKKFHSTQHYLKSGSPLPLHLPKCLHVSS